MIICKSAQEVAKMAKAGAVVAEVFEALKDFVHPGVTTKKINDYASSLIRKKGARPAFLGYRGYPAAICTSVNEQVVHGIPGKRVLFDGDILSIDIGVYLDRYYADAAVTLPVGNISNEAQRLIDVTKMALDAGISNCIPGNRLHDISAAIQKTAEMAGYSVVREFVGHGIGQGMHEDPMIPNYGKKGTGPRLCKGMVFALEPMINMGKYDVKIKKDKWTVVTIDGKLSAHFEHTVMVDEVPQILTCNKIF